MTNIRYYGIIRHNLNKGVIIQMLNQEMIDIATEVISVARKLESKRTTLNKSLAALDKKVATYEHLIECGQFPANIRATIYKEFDHILDIRRNVKLELAQLHSVQASLINKKVPQMESIKKAGTFKFTAEGMEKEFVKYMKYIKPEFKGVKDNGQKEEGKQ